MRPSALIFDMDDTLLATSAQWRHAENTLLAALGQEWSADLAARYKGMNALDVAATMHRVLAPAPVPTLSLPSCQQIMRGALLDAFAATPPLPMPGALDLVPALAQRYPLALASGSPLEAITSATQRLDLHRHFTVVLSSESVARGKPHPDVFLAAAAALGVRPGQCLVFEDSLIGVQAARAAGMAVFAIPSGDPAPFIPLATRVFASLAEITPDDCDTSATVTRRQRRGDVVEA